jgi:hypothetical protein
MQENNNNASKYFFENFVGEERENDNKNKDKSIYLIVFAVLVSFFIYFINILFSKSKKYK